jgi:hypothetical protein
MIAVIFEVWPKPERKKDYLDIAAQLRPLLEKIDGFISIERFESLLSRARFFRSRFSETKRQCRLGAAPTSIGSRRQKAVVRFFPTIACALPGSSGIMA